MKNFLILILIGIFQHTAAQDTTIITPHGTVTFSNVSAYGFTVSIHASVQADNFICLRATEPIDSVFLFQFFSSIGFGSVFLKKEAI